MVATMHLKIRYINEELDSMILYRPLDVRHDRRLNEEEYFY